MRENGDSCVVHILPLEQTSILALCFQIYGDRFENAKREEVSSLGGGGEKLEVRFCPVRGYIRSIMIPAGKSA